MAEENETMITGRVVSVIGELTASGEYMNKAVRLVRWPETYTVERLVITNDSEQGRLENWVHMGECEAGFAQGLFNLVAHEVRYAD